jgi:hypothetical protein
MEYPYCKYGHHMTDWVPYGMGNTAMESFECVYEGDLETQDPCNEDENCPAFVGIPDKYDEDERV